MAKQSTGNDRWNLLDSALLSALPQLRALLNESDESASRIVLKHRGHMDWLAMVTTVGPDGTPVIAFGNGFDALAALLALNATVTAGNWRPDRPWGS